METNYRTYADKVAELASLLGECHIETIKVAHPTVVMETSRAKLEFKVHSDTPEACLLNDAIIKLINDTSNKNAITASNTESPLG